MSITLYLCPHCGHPATWDAPSVLEDIGYTATSYEDAVEAQRLLNRGECACETSPGSAAAAPPKPGNVAPNQLSLL